MFLTRDFYFWFSDTETVEDIVKNIHILNSKNNDDIFHIFDQLKV